MKILAIESSCDETSVAVVENGTKIHANVVASSQAMYQKYGGILPEVASREQQKAIIPVLEEALAQAFGHHDTSPFETIKSEIDAIAVAVGPGLIGSLLMGVEAAKTIAIMTEKPILPVNHVLAHMYANFLEDPDSRQVPIRFPAISLVVSGGHTELFLMKNEKTLLWLGGTIDDAAGEAFDKTARLLGFGSGGGVSIQEAAKLHTGTSELQKKLPRPLLHDGTFNFSFSGLKTAVLREWNKEKNHSEEYIRAFAHEIQEAICDVLVAKTKTAAQTHGVSSILLSGGVSANLRLRKSMKSMVDADLPGCTLHIPRVIFCTDNAAYIGSYAFFRAQPVPVKTLDALPDLSPEVTE